MRLSVLKILGFLIAPFALLSLTGPASARDDIGDITPMECPFDTTGLEAEVECGFLTVAEDARDPSIGTFQIAFAVVHSVSPTPQPDPLIYIEGGPGRESLTRGSPGWESLDGLIRTLPLFATILQSRDIVFFDQRGTGYSTPAPSCGEIPQLDLTPERMEQCRAVVDQLGVNQAHFGSRFIADDITALADALGYDTYNLYGVSHGTRIALVTMRDHPDRIRAVILDSPLPPNVDPIVESVRAVPQAFLDLFDECEADWRCRLAYPDAWDVYLETAAELDAHPVEVVVDDAEGNYLTTATLDGETFRFIMFLALSHPHMRWMIPAAIFEIRDGNTDPAVVALRMLREGLPGQDYGTAMAVACNEMAPFTSTEELESAYELARSVGTSGGITGGLYDLCLGWGMGRPDPVEHDAVHSDIPTLLLVGRADLNTPPAFAEVAAETLSNHYFVLFPDAGHGVRGYGDCPLKVMVSFLNNPESQPDTRCINKGINHFVISNVPIRPLARAAAAVAVPGGLIAASLIGLALARMAARRQFTTGMTLRRADWKLHLAGLGITALLFLVYLGGFRDIALVPAVTLALSLALGIQAATVIASVDEPGLEILLACPRPFHWLSVERLALVFIGQLPVMAVGLLATLLVEPGAPVLSAMLRWLVASIFLAGVAGFFTVRARHAGVGVLIAIVVGLVFGVGGKFLVPVQIPEAPWGEPLDLIQPFLWLIHPFLPADALSPSDYLINRLVVTGVGLGLLGLMCRMLENTERLVLGMKGT